MATGANPSLTMTLAASGCSISPGKRWNASIIEFLAPARFDDVIDIGVRCAAFGRTSMRFVLEIHRGGEHPNPAK